MNKRRKRNVITDSSFSEDEASNPPGKKPRRSSRISASTDEDEQRCTRCKESGHNIQTCPRKKKGVTSETVTGNESGQQ